jgi:sugar O-acyltransferase (sialic acid O-acetyltransferase NeuD family)
MRIAICGAGGFGREVAPLALAQADEVVFVRGPGDPDRVGGLPCLPLNEITDDFLLTIAVGDGALRRRIEEARGRSFVTLMADTARLRGASSIGEGAILCDGAIVTDGARIGRHFHANLQAYVAHDCVVGDFVTLAPRASVNGNVVLDDDVYVGTGAVLKQGTPDRPLRIGRGAVIGMGAVVTRDVAPGETVVGNPARPLHR